MLWPSVNVVLMSTRAPVCEFILSLAVCMELEHSHAIHESKLAQAVGPTFLKSVQSGPTRSTKRTCAGEIHPPFLPKESSKWHSLESVSTSIPSPVVALYKSM